MTYDWRADALGCYHLAYRLIGLRAGVIPFATISEMYFVEASGGIP
jgi:hypothetical protein